MVCHQVHHAIDTLVRGHGGRTVLHDFFHRHRRGCLAIARKCMNDFTFCNEAKHRIFTRHHESANILCAEPVRRSLRAGFRSYCCDVGALPLQNAFDGHSLLPSYGLAAHWQWLAPQLGACPWKPFSSGNIGAFFCDPTLNCILETSNGRDRRASRLDSTAPPTSAMNWHLLSEPIAW